MAQAAKPHTTGLDLILIGKTGNGKSSTGNSILRRANIFKPSYNTTSGTKIPQFEWSTFEGRILQVVDSPGVLDTCEDEAGGITLVHNALQNAMLANPKGYHAFLVVLKFTTRFTGEEKKTIKILKGILGETFLKDYGIIVMTNGDTFENNCKKDKNFNLVTFCNDQSGPFMSVLEECNNRIVVFNNITEDEAVKYKQVKELIDMVDKLKNSRRRYTNEHFKNADKVYQHFLKSITVPIVTKEVLQEQSLIMHIITTCETLQSEQEKINSLQSLLPRLEALINSLQEKDEGTDALTDFISNAEDTRKMLETRIQIYTDIINKLNILKKRESELKKEELEISKNVKQPLAVASKIEECNGRKLLLSKEMAEHRTQSVQMVDNSDSIVSKLEKQRKDLLQKTNQHFYEKISLLFKEFGNFVVGTTKAVAQFLTMKKK